MPRTRSAVNRRTSTTKKVETKPPPKVPKPSREQTAKVVKKSRPKKGNETSDENTAPIISVGSRVPLTDDFGGALYLHDGTKTSLKQLVEDSINGIIVFVYPKPLDEDDDLCGEFDHAQLDWDPAEMNTIGISRDSVSSLAAFVAKDEGPIQFVSNLDGSLMKAMSITSPKGVIKQGGFIILKSGILLARAIGKTDKIMDGICRVLFPWMEENIEEMSQ
ncbi:uncharacterized protein TRIVIDRAFT_218300 [Trichoderma virens Gv29-8]|uniref:Alkyl hydroperoxide reductase subunit C/ Thiol specific antioxidant domain-containing protein n=1 Tax=Hypocrea virens (strain Gv29-8 / FGSC 10586) TaxID=413071 RepID=G9MHE0_HYPVG|nr:uncharacterized protein TRIVIDRAFT_218300 [Trichoderma virens Gv29-8]EHK26128.1 hypothetical protein TRIVIDRAFT_218300 [Trichoderma virens Gv29-8]